MTAWSFSDSFLHTLAFRKIHLTFFIILTQIYPNSNGYSKKTIPKSNPNPNPNLNPNLNPKTAKTCVNEYFWFRFTFRNLRFFGE